MRLSRLTTAEMLTLSTPWVTPTAASYKALLARPELAPLLPRLVSAHGRLLGRQAVVDPRGPALGKLLLALDDDHDNLVRGIDSALLALMLLASDDEGHAFWERIRQTLFPAGLGIINATYAAEAGNAMLLQKRIEAMSAADKKALKAQAFNGQSLWDLIARFIAVGLEIGQKETERQNLEPVGAAPGELHAARLEWVRTVTALIALIELGGENPDPVIAAQFVATLRAADQRAARRKAGKTDEGEPPPTPAADPAAPADPSPADKKDK